jgi:hypothetical protein
MAENAGLDEELEKHLALVKALVFTTGLYVKSHSAITLTERQANILLDIARLWIAETERRANG